MSNTRKRTYNTTFGPLEQKKRKRLVVTPGPKDPRPPRDPGTDDIRSYRDETKNRHIQITISSKKLRTNPVQEGKRFITGIRKANRENKPCDFYLNDAAKTPFATYDPHSKVFSINANFRYLDKLPIDAIVDATGNEIRILDYKAEIATVGKDNLSNTNPKRTFRIPLSKLAKNRDISKREVNLSVGEEQIATLSSGKKLNINTNISKKIDKNKKLRKTAGIKVARTMFSGLFNQLNVITSTGETNTSNRRNLVNNTSNTIKYYDSSGDDAAVYRINQNRLYLLDTQNIYSNLKIVPRKIFDNADEIFFQIDNFLDEDGTYAIYKSNDDGEETLTITQSISQDIFDKLKHLFPDAEIRLLAPIVENDSDSEMDEWRDFSDGGDYIPSPKRNIEDESEDDNEQEEDDELRQLNEELGQLNEKRVQLNATLGGLKKTLDDLNEKHVERDSAIGMHNLFEETAKAHAAKARRESMKDLYQVEASRNKQEAQNRRKSQMEITDEISKVKGEIEKVEDQITENQDQISKIQDKINEIEGSRVTLRRG